ncbi:MAG: hypothetical protein AAGK14_07345 [Verrucomicrobiota bacterium]
MMRKKMLGLLLVITVLVGTLGVTAYLYNEKSRELEEAKALIGKQDQRIAVYEEQLEIAGATINELQLQSARLIAVEKKQRQEAEESLEQFKTDLADQRAQAMAQAMADAQAEADAKKNAPAPKSFKFLKTKDGRTYYGVKVLDITPSGITILHAEGGGKIAYEKLPEVLVEKYQAEVAN